MPKIRSASVPPEAPHAAPSPLTSRRSSLTAPSLGALTPALAKSFALAENVCPITFQNMTELGHDVWVSSTDKERIYSRAALKQWLMQDLKNNLALTGRPIYRSPLTRRDMVSDAKALGLPIYNPLFQFMPNANPFQSFAPKSLYERGIDAATQVVWLERDIKKEVLRIEETLRHPRVSPQNSRKAELERIDRLLQHPEIRKHMESARILSGKSKSEFRVSLLRVTLGAENSPSSSVDPVANLLTLVKNDDIEGVQDLGYALLGGLMRERAFHGRIFDSIRREPEFIAVEEHMDRIRTYRTGDKQASFESEQTPDVAA